METKKIPNGKKIVTYIRIKIVYNPIVNGSYHDNVTGQQFILKPDCSNLNEIRDYINSQHKTIRQAAGYTRVSLKAVFEFKIE